MTNSESDSEVLIGSIPEPGSNTLLDDPPSKAHLKNIKRMAKRVYVKDSPIHGKGLFAARDLKEGESLGRLHGMMTKKEGTYVLWLNKRWGMEITNSFRFINHSADPNSALTDTKVVALRDIPKDEEITHDYGWE